LPLDSLSPIILILSILIGLAKTLQLHGTLGFASPTQIIAIPVGLEAEVLMG